MSAARRAIEGLLERRGIGKTICPSEAARAMAGPGGDWRRLMPEVHGAVDAMVAERRIQLSWKGAALNKRNGPYRIGALQL